MDLEDKIDWCINFADWVRVFVFVSLIFIILLIAWRFS